MCLLPQSHNLLLGQTGEGEHSDLFRDMTPVTGSTELLQLFYQKFPHKDDTTSHGLKVLLPLGEQGRVVQHDVTNAGTVGGRVRNLGSLDDGELGLDAHGNITKVTGGDIGISQRRRDEVVTSDTLVVESKVLGERLGNAELESLLYEVTNSPGILVKRSRGESLVGTVEEGEELLLSHDVGDLLPLLVGGIDTGGVVSASVENKNAALVGITESIGEALKVETASSGVVVRVVGSGKSDVFEDLHVVSPSRVGEVNLLVLGPGVEFREELGSGVQGSGTGDGLDGNNL